MKKDHENKEPRVVSSRICFEPLEPRLLLSGTWGVGGEAPSTDSQSGVAVTRDAGAFAPHTSNQNQGVGGVDSQVDLLAGATALNLSTVGTTANPDQSPPANDPTSEVLNQASRRELILINDNMADIGRLVADLNDSDGSRSVEVMHLDADRDGIAQVSEILDQYSDLSAVHFITHGSEGQIHLGDTWLNSRTLEQHSAAVAEWGQALTETGDILLYGCNIADGGDGQRLIDTIADLTGADVAASDDNTGHTSLSGDWELEYTRGRIETGAAFSAELRQDWGHLLNVAVDATSTGTSTGGDFSVSHTTSGTDRLMLVGVSMNLGGSQTVSSITYNGDHLSLVGVEEAGDARIEIWALLAPDVGTFNVDIAFSSPTDGNTAGVMTFTGVDQSTPLGAFASDFGYGQSTASASVSSAADELVFGVVSIDDPNFRVLTEGAGQTERWELDGFQTTGGGSTAPGAPTVDMSWTWPASDNWAAGGVSIKPSAANAAPVINSNGGGSAAFINAAENTTAVTTVTATDPDVGDTPTFSIDAASPDAANFNINSSTGVLSFASAPDFENPADTDGDNIYEVTVQASDGKGGADTQAINVNVTNENETPTSLLTTAISGGGLSINEDGGDDVYLIADDGGAIFGGLTALTAEVRFSMGAFPNSTNFFSYATASDDNVFKFNIRDNGDLSFSLNSNYIFSSAMDFRTLADGEQHTLSVTWDSSGGLWEIYVDGVSVDSGSSFQSGVTLAGGGTLVMGNDQDSVDGGYDTTSEAAATLYDARIFDAVRSDAEISANYRSTLPYDEAGLIANWRFSDLSVGGVVTDSVSGNNLTVQHAGGAGFTASTPSLTLALDENSATGTVVGTVQGTDAEREALIVSLLAADTDLAYSAETGKFYKPVNTSTGFTTAQSTAETTDLNGVNGQLVTIRSAAENELVTSLAASLGGDVWLGCTDATVEGEWRWIDGGSEADQFWSGGTGGYATGGAYANWESGAQPNNFGGAQNVAKIDPATGMWADEEAGDAYHIVVEWNADDVLDATNPLTYSIQSQTVPGAFGIDADSGDIMVVDGSLLDYESNSSHSITVRVSDGSLTYDQAFAITLNDVTEPISAPSDLSSGIALNVDGGNDAYLISNTGLSQSLTATTVEIQFAANNIPTETVFMSFNNPTDDEYSIQINEPANSLELDFGGGTVAYSAAIDYTTLFDGQLHSLAVSWDSTNGDWAVYIDGGLIDSGTGLSAGSALDTTNGQFVFGQEQDGLNSGYDPTQYFSGTLYDVRIWNEVRSAEEIALTWQQKFEPGSLPAGLVANWQMDGFNGSNEVVDVVSGNNLSIAHATGAGFTHADPVDALNVDENSANGTHVAYVIPSDAEDHNDLVADGLFLEAADPGSYASYADGETIGPWDVSGQAAVLAGTVWDSTPLGGRSVELGASNTAAISQSIVTQAGCNYQIIFVESGDWSGDSLRAYRVSAAGQSQDFIAEEQTGWAYNNMLWNQRSMTFTADAASTTLRFESLETGSSHAVIGDVRVIEIPQAIQTILNNDATLTYDAATGKFYRAVSSNVPIATAISDAAAAQINGVGGRVVTIGSAYENEVVRELAASISDHVWLGASDVAAEGEWYWYDSAGATHQFWQGAGSGSGGTPVGGAYTNWASTTEPDDSGGEDYAILRHDTGGWNDVSVSNSEAYIIEWDAREVLSNFAFTLTDDAGGRFAIDSNRGEVTVADGSLLDYETNASHTITVQVTDADGNSYSESLTISVNDVKEAPAGADNTVSTDEDTDYVFDAIDFGFSDADTSPADNFANVIITTTVANGTLYVDANGDGVVDGGEALNDSDTVSVADISAGRLKFKPATNAYGTGYDSFTFQVQDDGGGANDTDLTANTMTIDVNAINDAPVLDNSGFLTLTTISEDDTGNAGNLVSEIIASDGGDRITDVDAGALEGVAVLGLSSGNGTWEYNVGAGWTAVGSVSGTNSLLLGATDRLRFVPDGHNADTAFITFAAWDQTTGTAGTKVDSSTYGGTTAFSAAVETAAIIVTAVNDDPTITSAAAVNAAENQTAVTTVTATDVDGDIPTFSITGGADAALFDIDPGSGDLTFKNAPDFENPTDSDTDNVYEVEVTAVDGGGGLDAQAISVTVTNESDTLALWLSTDQNVGAPGADGMPGGWTESDVLEFSGPNLTHDATTDGELSRIIDFAAFTTDSVDAGALHYVNRDLTVGSGSNTFDLQVGDVLVSFLQDEIVLAAYTTSGSNETFLDSDLLVFRPTTSGDYSDGTFHLLLEDVVPDDLKGMTFVEQGTTIGGTDVPVGSFLIIQEASATTSIDLFIPDAVGPGTTSGTTTPLIDISTLGIDPNRLRGIELIERETTIGGQTLAAGSILATLNVDDNVSGVGSNNLLVERNDVFVLNLTSTGLGTTAGTATMFFDGSDVGLDDNPSAESPYALAMFDPTPVVNTAPVVSAVDLGSMNEDGSLLITEADLLTGSSDVDGDSLSVVNLALVTGSGTLTDNGDTTWTFTPTADWNGAVGFSFDVTDGTAPVANTASLIVTAVNDLPTTSGLANQNLSEDFADDTIDLKTIFADVETADADLIYTVSGNSNIGVSIDVNGIATISAATAHWNGTETITFTAEDESGARVDASADFIVAPVNDAPVFDSTAVTSATEDAAYSYSIATSDPDSGASLTISASTLPVWLTLTDNGDGTATLSGTPTNADVGDHGVVLEVTDGSLSATQSFTITVADTNDAPTGTTLVVAANEETATAIDISGNVSDVDGTVDLSTTTVTSGPSNGVLINNGDGTFSYTGNTDFVGTDSFTYTVEDNDGLVSSDITVTINVSDINDAPTGTTLVVAANEETATAIDISGNVSDVDGTVDLSTTTVTSGPSNSSLINNGDGTFTYTGNTDFVGTDSFTYTVEDNDGQVSSDITVTINVSDINDAPTGTTLVVAANEETATPIDISGNVSDVDGTVDLTTTTVTSGPANGSLTNNGDGTFTYTGNTDFVGTDSFTYTVEDNDGQISSDITIIINVSNTNDAPVAVNDAITTDEDTPFSSTIDLDANDTDVDGDPLSVVAGTFTTAQGGTIVIAADGSYTYTPATNFNGTDSIDYTVTDGSLTDVGTLTMTVTPVVDLSAVDDSFSTAEDTALVDSVATNDSTTSGGSLSYVVDSDVSNGTLVLNNHGSFTYTPGADFNGADSFSYTVSDAASHESRTQSVTLTVTAVNDAPVAAPDSFTVNEGSTTNLNLAANDNDADDGMDPGSIAIVSGPTHGSIVMNGDGTVDYTHDGSETASDSFTYTIEDLTGTISNQVAVTITVTPEVDASADAPPPTGGGVDPEPGPDEEDDPIDTRPEPDPEPDVMPPLEAEGSPPEEVTPSYGSSPKIKGIAPPQSSVSRSFVPTLFLKPFDVSRPNDDAVSAVSWRHLYDIKTELASQAQELLEPVTAFFSPEIITQELDRIQMQIDDYLKLETEQGRFVIGTATGIGASVFVGYVIWALRGSSLLFGALSAMPMWRCFDPLPVLMGKDRKGDEDKQKQRNQHDSEDREEKRIRDLLESGSEDGRSADSSEGVR